MKPTPTIATVSPSSTRVRPAAPTMHASGSPSASQTAIPSGIGTTRSSIAMAYSANPPLNRPLTAAPGRTAVTSLPTSTTSPATSCPSSRGAP